jgi:hypothetical protein
MGRCQHPACREQAATDTAIASTYRLAAAEARLRASNSKDDPGAWWSLLSLADYFQVKAVRAEANIAQCIGGHELVEAH